jgi:CheY-like chemotaxis protein
MERLNLQSFRLGSRPAIESPLCSVLWITDNPDAFNVDTAACFALFGIRVTFVESAEEVLATPDMQQPDLVLADWDSEGVDGRAAVKALQGSSRIAGKTPAILLTDRRVPHVLATALAREGFRWVLRKPLVLSSLPKLIHRTLNSCRGFAENPHLQFASIIAEGQTASGAGFVAVE